MPPRMRRPMSGSSDTTAITPVSAHLQIQTNKRFLRNNFGKSKSMHSAGCHCCIIHETSAKGQRSDSHSVVIHLTYSSFASREDSCYHLVGCKTGCCALFLILPGCVFLWYAGSLPLPVFVSLPLLLTHSTTYSFSFSPDLETAIQVARL